MSRDDESHCLCVCVWGSYSFSGGKEELYEIILQLFPLLLAGLSDVHYPRLINQLEFFTLFVDSTLSLLISI